jgi:hypothetical protein
MTILNGSSNGSRGIALGAAVTLGLAALTGVISWTFAAVVANSSGVERLRTQQEEQVRHRDWQDRSLDELDKRVRTIELWQYNVKAKGQP